MPLFNPVLRQYTPPTCTLEIKAQESPLSRWVGRPVLKKLRFELHFDDPRQTDDQRITIWGDRADLEALYETVTNYVQGLLEKSPTQLPLSVAAGGADGSNPLIASDGANHLDAPTSRTFTAQEPVEQPERGDFAEAGRPHLRPVADPNLQFSMPHLQPRGLLAHDLFLGRLATPESGSVVSLSALQLFDLATALDEYASDVVALPKLSGSPLQRIPLPVWAGTAAAALLAVGLTPALIRLMSPPPKTTTTVAVAPSPEILPTDAPLITQVTPDPNAPTPTPSALVSPLPVPTPSGLASPAPNSLGLNPQAPGTSGLGSSLPGPLAAPPTQTFPGQSSSQPPVQFSLPSRSTSPLPRNAPQTGFNPGFPQAASQFPSQRTQRQQPQLETRNSRRSSTSAPAAPSAGSIPNLSNLPPVVASSGRSGQTSAKQRDTSSAIPELSPNTTLPPITTAPETIPDIPTAQVPPNIASRSVPSETEALGLPTQERQQTPSADNVAKGRLFDTIPQVAEARSYFQQRWKPPTGLTKPLEYSLQIGNDGVIERIIPLTESARNYIDSTGMPLVGEKFVSPIEGGRDANIRVVFNADGKVETLLEP